MYSEVLEKYMNIEGKYEPRVLIKQMRGLSQGRKYFKHKINDTLYNLKENNPLYVEKEYYAYRTQFAEIFYGYMEAWDKIRDLIKKHYNVNMVCDIPDDKVEEANRYAMQITDELYDEMLERLKGIQVKGLV